MTNLEYIIIRDDYCGWCDHRQNPHLIHEFHLSEEWKGYDFFRINEEIHSPSRFELDLHDRLFGA